MDVIGRMYTVSPSEGDRWFLRLLLTHVAGATSFEDLRTVQGIVHDSFRSAAMARGLFERDQHLQDTLGESMQIKPAWQIQRLFGVILAMCQPANARELWDYCYDDMVEDLVFMGEQNEKVKINSVIAVISPILLEHGQVLEEVYPDLPRFDPSVEPHQRRPNWLYDSESSIPVNQDDINNVNLLNTHQHEAYESIMLKYENNEPGCFFIDGPGGAGKTFLYRCLLEKPRADGHIAIACASSGEFGKLDFE